MAVVVSSVADENIGLFVDVIAASTYGQGGIELTLDEGPIWHCKSRGLIRYETVYGEVVLASEGPIPDRSLRPIRPGQQHSETSVKCEIDAPQFA